MLLNSIYIILSFIYGILSIVAGISQLKSKDLRMKLNCILGVILGGILVILSNFNIILSTNYLFYILIIGLALLHISAIINGYLMYGKLNLKHHFVRFIISFIVLVIFIISKN